MQMYRQVQGVVGTMWVGVAKVVWVSVYKKERAQEFRGRQRK